MTAPISSPEPPVKSLRAGKPPTPAGKGGKSNFGPSGAAARHRMEVSLDGKQPQDAVHYMPAPTPQVQCAQCINWQPPSSCAQVAGPIMPSGTCDLFVSAAEQAESQQENNPMNPMIASQLPPTGANQ